MKTCRGSLYHLELEDASHRAPQVGVGKVVRSADYISILQLIDKKEGYDPTGGF